MKIIENQGKQIITKKANSLLFRDFRRPLIEIMTDLRKPIQPGVIISDGQARSPSPKARLYNTSVGQHLTEVKG